MGLKEIQCFLKSQVFKMLQCSKHVLFMSLFYHHTELCFTHLLWEQDVFLFSFSISTAITVCSFHWFCYSEGQKLRAWKEYLNGKLGVTKRRLYCNMNIYCVNITSTFLWNIWPEPLPEKENQGRGTFYQHQCDFN